MSAWPANSRTSCIVGAVADGVVDRGLAQLVDADAAAAQPRRVDAGGLAVFLDQPPGRLAVEVPAHQASAVGRQGPEERAFPVVLDAGRADVGQDGSGRVEQDLAALLVAVSR